MSLESQPCHGQPLPVNPYPEGNEDHNAYEHCRLLELRATWNVSGADDPRDPPFEGVLESMPPVFAARVLGYSLRYAPNDAGRTALARDILACTRDPPSLAVLAYLYVFGLIRVFYNSKGPTPAASPAFTPRLPLKSAAQNSHLLELSSCNASDLRALALLRDDHRCVFTGMVDMDCYGTAAEVGPSTKAAPTNVAHIISQSLTDDIPGITPAHQAKFPWAKTAGATIERFAGFRVHDILGQDNLHNPKNAFIASVGPHRLFDNLDIWLTPAMDAQDQVITDTYNVSHAEGLEGLLRAMNVNRPVVFKSLSVNGKVIPAPDPRIIELHAACAQTAHASGATELLRELYRDTDNIAVMTQPNATYELSRALKTLQFVSTMT